MIKTKFLALVLFISVVFSFLGFFIGSSLTVANIEADMLSELRQKLDSRVEKGLIPFLFGMIEEEIEQTSLFGEIINIENNLIEVRVLNYYRGGDLFDYLRESDDYLKTVKIEDDTEIVKRETKSLEEMKLPDEIGLEEIMLPEPYKETRFSKEDLKKGITISVEAKKEFGLEENEVIGAKKIIAE